MEEWRKIPGYESYEVSSLGNVRRDGRVLKPTIHKSTGYRRFTYRSTGNQITLRVGRCVCLAFHPPIVGKATVDHINRIRTDDRVENLRWADRSEQIINQDRVLNESGEKNINKTRCGSYQIRIKRGMQTIYYKLVKTLPEAIEARDNFLQNINT